MGFRQPISSQLGTLNWDVQKPRRPPKNYSKQATSLEAIEEPNTSLWASGAILRWGGGGHFALASSSTRWAAIETKSIFEYLDDYHIQVVEERFIALSRYRFTDEQARKLRTILLVRGRSSYYGSLHKAIRLCTQLFDHQQSSSRHIYKLSITYKNRYWGLLWQGKSSQHTGQATEEQWSKGESSAISLSTSYQGHYTIKQQVYYKSVKIRKA